MKKMNFWPLSAVYTAKLSSSQARHGLLCEHLLMAQDTPIPVLEREVEERKQILSDASTQAAQLRYRLNLKLGELVGVNQAMRSEVEYSIRVIRMDLTCLEDKVHSCEVALKCAQERLAQARIDKKNREADEEKRFDRSERILTGHIWIPPGAYDESQYQPERPKPSSLEEEERKLIDLQQKAAETKQRFDLAEKAAMDRYELVKNDPAGDKEYEALLHAKGMAEAYYKFAQMDVKNQIELIARRKASIEFLRRPPPVYVPNPNEAQHVPFPFGHLMK